MTSGITNSAVHIVRQTKKTTLWQTTLLIGIGCLQLTGDVLGLDQVKALGALTHASPAPKVFTSQNGYETYSPKFYVQAHHENGSITQVQLTPALNATLSGPYNRRNAYGATLSYGPVLASNPATLDMFESALHFALCRRSGLIQEVGLPLTPSYSVRIQTRNEDSDRWPTQFRVTCQSETGVQS